jgi:HEAT repeat protein
MRTVRRRVLVLGAILVAALAWHDGEAQGPSPEPVYQGRSFGEWRQDLQGGRPMVRVRAVAALCQFGEPAVPLLVGAIADYDFNVRTAAIFCLGRMGPAGEGAVSALIKTLEDRDWIVRRSAAAALGLLGPTAAQAAPAVARTAVQDSSPEVRQTARSALGRLGPDVRETTRPTLEQLSRAGVDEAVRARAAELLNDLDKR